MNERKSEDADLKAWLASLGQRVREARAKRGMARRLLARDSGVSERYLAQLESGTGNPTLAVLRQIANAVDYALPLLIGAPGSKASMEKRDAVLAKLAALPQRHLEAVDAAIDGLLTQDAEHADMAMDKAQRIALIGLRGAGKSTLGRRLAEKNNVAFVELNRVVEQDYGGSIGELLALSGQPAFRRMELRALQNVLETHQSAIIATGGGIVSEPETYALLLSRCHTIWVQASPDEHMNRVIDQGDLRPMAKNAEAMEDLKAILTAREAEYRRADGRVNTSNRTVEDSLAELDLESSRLLNASL